MGQVASYITNSINMCDAVKFAGAYPKRERLGAMSKYGIRCDGSRDRPERKEDGADIFLELLRKLNTANSLKWLAWFEHLQSIGEQIHDMCDALSLALQSSLTRYKNHGKQEVRLMEQKMRDDIKARRALLNSIQQAPTRAKKAAGEKKEPKKARKPAKKGADNAGNEDKADKPKRTRKKQGETEGKKTRAKAVKASTAGATTKRKRAKKSTNVVVDITDDVEDVDGEDVIVDDEESSGPSKKKHNMGSIELKYPILLRDESFQEALEREQQQQQQQSESLYESDL
jgi:chemotaxis protein histidine kinase CheA